MRSLCLTLLLLGGALCSAQDAQPSASIVSGPEAAAAVDSLTKTDAKDDATNATAAQTKLTIPSQEQILSQMPPVTLPRSGIPTVDAFYLMFPALSSLLRWGSLFPAQTLLGAVPDNLQAAPSKVVLVLADDANGHKSRVTRQDAAPAAPPAPAPPAALNGAAMLQQMQQMLGQMPPPPNLAQMMPRPPAGWLPDGFTLGQMPPLPDNFNLGQMPPMPDAFNLGQMAPVMQSFGLPSLDGLLGQAPVAPATTAAPPAAKAADEPAAPAPATPTLGQAQPPGFGALFDGSNNLLGSALSGIPGAPTPDAFMAGLRQFLPGSDRSPQASDISEVRVKPDNQDSIGYRAPQQTQAQLAQLKIKSALQMEQEKQRVPLLWFRMPSKQENEEEQENGKNTDRAQIESKLEAFERQVIEELQQLQQIERLAREMRANAQGETPRNGPAYKLRYPLSRTPVHKITRADIERALRDDYVRRLLHREMQRRTYAKRQVGAAPQSLSKEDIVKVMAYAYRMANENAERRAKEQQLSQQMQAQNPMTMRQWMEGGAKAKEQQRQWMQEQTMTQQENQKMMRQWAENQAKSAEMMRQWTEDQTKANQENQQQQLEQQQQQQRQWTEEQAKEQQAKEQQREWSEDQAKAHQQNPTMLRQWTEDQAKAENTPQQIPMTMQQPAMTSMMREFMEAQRDASQFQMPMPLRQQGPMMMRQWTEDQAKAQQEQRQWMEQQAKAQQEMQQRQWTEDQAKAQREQTPMMAQQQNPMLMQQWTEDQAKAQQEQQRQWSELQAKAQQDMQQRQWTEDQAKTQQEQQRQWSEHEAKAQQDMQQRQWTEDQAKAQQEQILEAQKMKQAAERQWAAEKMLAMQQQQQQPQMEQQQPQLEAEGMLGEAKPQMPENAGQARHKVDVLGLGKDHRKKSKSNSAHTVINYYQNAPPASYAPAYGPSYAHAHRPSYGTSYGGGGYGSNGYGGYRAAVGNDEIDHMLRQHNTMMATHFRQ
ncbi:defective chorion-1 protein, FC106 isoform isoform X2 [Drosophila hydei]|uniref:Defective chorion-1 protein, FC106 isoform isoform X2 n=1 Tax=Drosophila hydei TaxID=7224 RepID=A0A6J1MD04_DROHY|nr:defective chorion-1 protein, FC106 isoform isoform X2 [Drosophila hydei]